MKKNKIIAMIMAIALAITGFTQIEAPESKATARATESHPFLIQPKVTVKEGRGKYLRYSWYEEVISDFSSPEVLKCVDIRFKAEVKNNKIAKFRRQGFYVKGLKAGKTYIKLTAVGKHYKYYDETGRREYYGNTFTFTKIIQVTVKK